MPHLGKSKYLMRDDRLVVCGFFELHHPASAARLTCNSVKSSLSSQDLVLYASRLRQCASTKDLLDGKRVHALILQSKHHQDTHLGNLLIKMYGICGHVEEALLVFENLDHPNLFSWNILMGAYTRSGHLQEAKRMFDRMPYRDVISCNTIVAGFGQVGDLQEARNLFERMPYRDVVSWNTMITAYTQNGYLQEARNLFDQMPRRDVVSSTTMIVAYAQTQHVVEAKIIFDQMPERDVVSWTSVVAAYAQNGHLREAKNMFEKMPEQNAISWNVMITAYARKGHLDEARAMFEEMPQCNVTSGNAMIDAYAKNGSLQEARSIFERMAERDLVSWTTMVSAYALRGYLQEARDMVDNMPQRNSVSWNVLISAYSQYEQGKEAIVLFRLMDLEGLEIDEVTFASALDACSSILALAEGRLIHANLIHGGFHRDVIVATSLIHLYGKCGSLQEAKQVFEEMFERDAVLWTAMISAYAHTGHGKEALALFDTMAFEGMQPDQVTFINLLNACSHAGMFSNGCQYFGFMKDDYEILPVVEHFRCMIDILGRAGWLEEAENLINCMPFKSDAVAWTTLLSACKTHGDVNRGARSAEKACQLDPQNSAPYTLLSNMYLTNKSHQRSSS